MSAEDNTPLPSDPLALDHRTGLPDALRVLAEQYPREAWDRHANLTELCRFWLDRHLMFRKMQTTLIEDTESWLAGSITTEKWTNRLYRIANMQLSELHGHHHIEDDHYFPRLKLLDKRLEKAFDLLDADHHALEAGLQGMASSANAVFQTAAGEAGAMRENAEKLHASLRHFDTFLDRHLTDEEEIVVPVLLAHPEAGLG